MIRPPPGCEGAAAARMSWIGPTRLVATMCSTCLSVSFGRAEQAVARLLTMRSMRPSRANERSTTSRIAVVSVTSRTSAWNVSG